MMNSCMTCTIVRQPELATITISNKIACVQEGPGDDVQGGVQKSEAQVRGSQRQQPKEHFPILQMEFVEAPLLSLRDMCFQGTI